MTCAKRATALPSYLNGLLSAGKVGFTRDGAQKALEASVGASLDAAERRNPNKPFLGSNSSHRWLKILSRSAAVSEEKGVGRVLGKCGAIALRRA